MGVEIDDFDRATLEWIAGGDLTIVDEQLATGTSFGAGASPFSSLADFRCAISVPVKSGGGFGFSLDIGGGDSIVLEIDSAGAGTWRILGFQDEDFGAPVFTQSGTYGGGSSIGGGERVRFSRAGDTLVGAIANTSTPDIEDDVDWTPVVVATASELYAEVAAVGIFINQTSTRLDNLEVLVAPPIQYSVRLSGGASNTDPKTSIGDDESSAPAGSDLLDNLTASERDAGATEYRLLYIHNEETIDSAGFEVVVDDTGTFAGSAQLAVATATEAPGETAAPITDAYTAPSGVTFDTTADLGTIGPGDGRGLWVRRTSPAAQPGGLTLSARLNVTITPA